MQKGCGVITFLHRNLLHVRIFSDSNINIIQIIIYDETITFQKEKEGW